MIYKQAEVDCLLPPLLRILHSRPPNNIRDSRPPNIIRWVEGIISIDRRQITQNNKLCYHSQEMTQNNIICVIITL